ncbi:sensor histidine kinase [Sediminibacterium sp. TEGAF015]|uniref:sensor histidine kinase n=1 Tax=Sediminibacterium sp. TEGAF015 TaxID=575378 RepID=UPI0021FD660F|nr:HAMP domain-containing sensor histidine kinase [Sediminibacterium sp. TEGAF015]BDQ10821.1 hypothetical protein TEGAF0_00380 [Sediminibacterium sp. TEGAF015]
MRKSQSNIFYRLLSLGNSESTPFREAYKNYMFNLFLMMAAPFALLVMIINLYLGEYVLASFNILHLLIFIFGFYISYSQRYVNLRPLLLFLGAAIAAYTAYFFKNGNEYRFLIMIVAAVVLCEKNWQYIIFVVFVSTTFVVIRLDELPISSMGALQIIEKTVKLAFPLGFFSICLYYFKSIYFQNQYRLEKAYEDLNENRAEKDRILNAVAHDLRSPLSGISGISRMMLTDENLDDNSKEMFQLIEQSASSSLRLIGDLMQTNMSVDEYYQLKHIELNKLIRQSLQILFYTAKEKGIEINMQLTDEKLMINADQDKFERVITNLVTNAIKFSRQGASVIVSLEKKNQKAVFSVRDNGIGIPKQVQEKVFDLFTIAKRKGTNGEKSFGIGLAISKKIVELHQGKIYFETEENKGTCFIVELPLVA